MAINLKFDLMGNPEPPSIVLANRNGNKLGQLNVDVKSIDVKDLLKTSEFSFTLNKYIDGKPTPHWDKVVDFKLVHCPEWDLWYGIKVELDEATETVKTVFCTQLGQEELSQIKVYNTEINTEADIARDDYKISILYDEDNPDASILHRVMSKAPHYSIAHIDDSLKRIQRSFSFDDASICDAFDEIEEEVGCLVVYNSNSDKNGMPKRDVSIYDLLQNCKNPNCKHRGEFTDKCPKCSGTDIDYGYGEDTTIFVTSDELATEGIQLVTDTDSVKNCFKLEAGDDLMTATIRNCNPNGSDYIWYFSDAVKEDMSKELVEAIESYDAKYKECYESRISNLDANLVSQYNALVEKYNDYYNTKSTCLNSDCKHEGYFENECPLCHGTNILTGRSLQTINSPIIGYPALMNAYYNTIDLALYLESGLMPSVEMSKTSAKEQLDLLSASSLSSVAVNVEKIDNVSLATANSAVLSMAKVIVKPTYKVQIKTSELSDVDKQLWRGQFIVTNYSDENDTASNEDDEYVYVTINNDTEEFIQQKIEKALNKENTDDYSISGLFEKEYNDFCTELTKYALNPLKSFYDACDACLNILVEQGVGSPSEDSDENTDEDSDLYKELYEPYYNKSVAIANEIKLREDEIAIIKGIYNEDEESDEPDIDGLQTDIIDCRNAIQEELNFENYLGESLWLEFCAYRREDKYSNSNYISDGLSNAELFEKANEFIEVAEQEIFKSAELQHSISATLNNLLSLPKFKPLLKSFKTGNWIRVQVDDRIFKLRLLEYNFNYGDLESIPVEFSDVTKIKNGTTDVQDVFSQAASMASSYDSVQRQAKKGDVARSTIDQWLVDGLNAANVQIQSNNSEEVLLTKNGLLARSYSDITGTYSPEQLKITHNIMAYTDDNWKTVRQAIGKQDHKIYDKDKEEFVDKIGYGMNADFVNAGIVSGSQIVGGDIYSDNYSKSGKAGSYLNLRDGTFNFGGGKITFNGTELLINPDNDLGVTEADVTRITNNLISTAEIDAKQITTGQLSAERINTTGLIAENISATTIEGKTIKSSDFIGGSLLIGDTTKIGDYAEIANNGALTCTNVDIRGGMLKMGSKNDEETHTWIDTDGTLNTYNANISGEIRAASGAIGGFTIETTEIKEDGSKSGGWLYSGVNIGADKSIFLSATDMQGNADFFDGTISNWRLTVGNKFGVTSDGATYMSDCEITGGSLRMGNSEEGYHTWVSEDGVLNANGANITGTINAVKGNIGTIMLSSSNEYQKASLVTDGVMSPIRISNTPTYAENTVSYTQQTLDMITSPTDVEFRINMPDVTEVSVSSITTKQAHCVMSESRPIDINIAEYSNDNGMYYFESFIYVDDITDDIALNVLSFVDGSVVINNTNIDDSVKLYAELTDANTIIHIYSEGVYVSTYPDWYDPNLQYTVTVDCSYIVETGDTLEVIDSQYNNGVATITISGGDYANTQYLYDIDLLVTQAQHTFALLDDGSLYANGVDVSGHIDADSGSIGVLTIDKSGLQFKETVNKFNDSDFTLSANRPYYIYQTNGQIKFSDVVIEGSQPIFESKYTIRFMHRLADIEKIIFEYQDENASQNDLAGIGVWYAKDGISSADFIEFKSKKANGFSNSIEIDTSSITEDFFVCLFFNYTSINKNKIQLIWSDIKVDMSNAGYKGNVVPIKRTTESGLKPLYVDEFGRLCVLSI